MGDELTRLHRCLQYIVGVVPTGGDIFGVVGKLVTPVDCKSAASGTAGSTPAGSTKIWTSGISWEVRRGSNPSEALVQFQRSPPIWSQGVHGRT